MLTSLSISARIYGGFGIILALLAGLSLYTVNSMSEVEHTFENYSEAGEHTMLVEDTADHVAEARIARLNYQITGDDKARQTVESAIAEVVETADKSGSVFDDPNEAEIARLFTAVAPIAQNYRDGFAEQVATTTRGNALRAEFQKHGFELYSAIEQVIKLAREENENELAHQAAELGLQFFRSRMRATLYMFTADVAELDGAVERIALMNDAYEKMMRAAVMQPKAQELGKSIRTMIDRFETELAEARTLLGAQAEAERQLQFEVGPRLTAALTETAHAIAALQTDYGARTRDRIAEMSALAMAIGAGALALGAALAWAIGRWIAGAVSGMAATMTRMAGGELDLEVAGAEQRHELGAMARALQTFKLNGLEKRRLDAEAAETQARAARAAQERAQLQAAVAQVIDSAAAGDFARRVDPRYADDDLNEFARQLNTLLDTVREGVGETSRVMAALARGDLAARMKGAYRGAFAELQDNVNATVSRLRDTVSEIMTVSDAMRERTGAIAASAETLSSRAENQAASLEEIAATMEQMSATVRTNAENAMSARDLSADAHTRADKGGAIVRKAVGAMGEIAAGSGKIADIVSVIDGFAFQTNLLALNAAVEAARAGEAGKGFAVVASEVRMLAQRSAEAARDIKSLIEESAHQVEGGVKLVEETGRALTEIVEAIGRVSDTITEISEASREQSSGVEEITSAITSMDEITQQNSAMADQSAAAARSLAEQAQTLERLMGFFSLGKGGASEAAAA